MDLSVKAPSDEDKAIVQSYQKLQLMASLKQKMAEFNDIEELLISEFGRLKMEESALAEYQEEFKSLQQERLMHQEYQRQIHSDITDMENTMKSAENERIKLLNTSKELFYTHLGLIKEIIPLSSKAEAELGLVLDVSSLGSRLKEEGITPEALISPGSSQQKYSPPGYHYPQASTHSDSGGLSSVRFPADLTPDSSMVSAAAAAAAAHQQQTIMNARQTFMQQMMKQHAAAAASVPQMAPPPPQPLPPASSSQMIRQHPAPMKQCLSCYQQIHRNAPICPMCKAKSRSQNPKKPKKRTENN